MSNWVEYDLVDGGVDLARVLFWGPEAVRASASRLPRQHVPRGIAEAAAVDFDRRVLLWFADASLDTDP